MPLPPAPTKRAALLAPDAYSLKASDAALEEPGDAAGDLPESSEDLVFAGTTDVTIVTDQTTVQDFGL
mgnify:CR=1 FL=1